MPGVQIELLRLLIGESMLRPLSRTSLIGALVASAIVLASCGAGSVKATSTTVPATKAPSDSTGQEAPAATGADTPAKSGGSDFCAVAVRLDDEDLDDMFNFEDFETNPAAALQNFKDGFAAMGEVVRDLKAIAPAEIAADLNLISEAFDRYLVELRSITTFEEFSSSDSEVFGPELEEHFDRVSAHVERACGIDLED